MAIKNRKVTVRNLIEAMRKNGYEQIQGSWVRYADEDETKVIAGCAYGQAAVNLSVDALALSDLLYNVIFNKPELHNTVPDVIRYNDSDHLSLQAIADRVEEWAKENRLLSASWDIPVRKY